MPHHLKQKVQERIDELSPRLIDLSRKIHAHPEVKFEERRAAAWLCEMLQSEGFEVETCLAGLKTAFRAHFRGRGAGPCVGFLLEYDALNGLGHGCGHNLIAGAGLGAGLGLASVLQDVEATVWVIGTPGEEGGGGKVIMAENGVFDALDAVLMFHPSGKNILWKKSLARRKLVVEFHGQSAHAASYPDKGVNALDALIVTFSAVNGLRQQVAENGRIHGIISHGGESPNVIPDYTRAEFYVRALDDAYCDQLLQRVESCARGAATATGCRVELSMVGAYKSLKTNLPLAEAFRHNIQPLGVGFEEVDPFTRLGSTDMGDVSQIVPAIHPYLDINDRDQELIGHTTAFTEAAARDQAMQTMLTAAKALAGTALDVCLDRELLGRIKAAFK